MSSINGFIVYSYIANMIYMLNIRPSLYAYITYETDLLKQIALGPK